MTNLLQKVCIFNFYINSIVIKHSSTLLCKLTAVKSKRQRHKYLIKRQIQNFLNMFFQIIFSTVNSILCIPNQQKCLLYTKNNSFELHINLLLYWKTHQSSYMSSRFCFSLENNDLLCLINLKTYLRTVTIYYAELPFKNKV